MHLRKQFLILNGSNGATYIFNTKNRSSISKSLQFYKGRTFKSSFLRQGLKLFLFTSPKIGYGKLKTIAEIQKYLKKAFPSVVPNFSEDCSFLISPTRDKMIIHEHDNHFLKIAFGESYKKVRNEGEIYKLLQDSETFLVSSFFDEEEVQGQYFSFKMGPPRTKLRARACSLVDMLVELFLINSINSLSLTQYIDSIFSQTQKEGWALTSIKLKEKFNAGQKTFPVGLVHRDFKPWNVKETPDGLLIFDFEETIKDGLPLEDLFNYYLDPIIRYKKTLEVIELAYNEKQVKMYKEYLEKLQVEIEFEIFLLFYAWNRYIFWKENKDALAMNAYKALFEQLLLKTGVI